MKDKTRISPTCQEGRHAACVGAFAPIMPGTFVACDCVCHATARTASQEALQALGDAQNVTEAIDAAEAFKRRGQELDEAGTWLHDLKETEGYAEEMRYSIFCMRHFQREPREMVRVDGATHLEVIQQSEAAGFRQQADGSYLCAECVAETDSQIRANIAREQRSRELGEAAELRRLLLQGIETLQNLYALSDRARYGLALDMLRAGGAWPSAAMHDHMQFEHFDVFGAQDHSIVLYFENQDTHGRTFATDTFAAFGFETVWTGPDRLRLRSEEELRAGRRF